MFLLTVPESVLMVPGFEFVPESVVMVPVCELVV